MCWTCSSSVHGEQLEQMNETTIHIEHRIGLYITVSRLLYHYFLTLIQSNFRLMRWHTIHVQV